MASNVVIRIPIKDIYNPDRVSFSPKQLQAFSRSVTRPPIFVDEYSENGYKYRVVDGGVRLKAFEQLGHEDILAIVRKQL